ncbi:hypothetical protein AVEN_127930-1, partial [Araneus ventricosus]
MKVSSRKRAENPCILADRGFTYGYVMKVKGLIAIFSKL